MSYQGPPPFTQPPPGWRPEVVTAAPPPRRLPEQDHAALDAAERAARWFTLMVATATGLVLLVVALIVIARMG